MNNTINGRTPDEIKKGLDICIGEDERCAKCSYVCYGDCRTALEVDALKYIQQLEARIDTLNAKAVLFDEAVAAGEKMKRERDAAVADLAGNRRCETCKYYTPGYFCIGCRRGDQWEWRGAQEVE